MPPGFKPWHLVLLAAGVALLSFIGPPVCPEPGCASVEDMHIQASGASMYRLMMPLFVGALLLVALGFLVRRS